ncbi:hypothetical protein GH714_038627 [Hevea brasiliensis]|uniref:Uncharacterized protein n=1 Tax=Hevea brasiliensis TaxID=3981 RepID=A0A6A6KE90_HEVBR|nr:hypothetical protein GH714_038627 [Hevea brasiliensis]
MARVKQVTTKPQKFMGDAMKAAASSEKEREEGTEVENSNEETEIVAERARKRKGKGIARSEPSAKKKKMEKAPASKPLVQQNIFKPSMKEVVKGESFSVRVKKKSQIVDVDFLASVLNLPNDGNRIGTFKDSRKLEGYDEKAFQLSIFGGYPQGTAGPSNAKVAGPSGVKISEVEEEEEEHVEATEKVQEESKLAEVEEVEKNDEKEKSAEEASEAEQEPDKEKSSEIPHLILKA